MIDNSMYSILSECMNRKQSHIKRLIVDSRILREGEKIVVITGYEECEDFDMLNYCGFIEIKNCVFLFIDDCENWEKDNSEQKRFRTSYKDCDIGGTIYSWTYLIKKGKIFYWGNLNNE